MKTKRWFAIVIIALGSMFWISNRSVRAAAVSQYKYIYCDDGQTEQALNQYAAQGWELVAVTRTENNQHGLVLKKSQ